MDFNFSEEQSMLRDTVASFLQDKYDFDKRQKLIKSESGWSADIWEAFANELGILGAPFSEELGGLGGGAIENMIVMEEFGKALVVEPYLGTVVIGGGFLKHSGHAQAAELIGGIIEGRVTIAFGYAEPQARYNWADVKTTAKKEGDGYVLNGHKAVVIGAPWASHLIVTARTSGGQRDEAGISVFLVEKGAKGVVTRDYPTVDGQRASEVYLENVSVPASALIGEEGNGLPLVNKVLDEAAAAACAEAVGAMRKMHEQTLEYARQRKQFGTAIANFQVLQHRMVDMFMNVEQSVSMTYLATLKLDESDAERA
jgi:alkylation response protein AidB-like acyl-CoA dehydrogenase